MSLPSTEHATTMVYILAYFKVCWSNFKLVL